MAAGGFSRPAEIDKRFFCPICLEILQSPTTIPCGHTFCTSCLNSSVSTPINSSPTCCPMCRAEFNPRRQLREIELERELQSTRARCQDCGKQLLLSALRAHRPICSNNKAFLPQFTPVAPTSQPVSSVTNRSTFPCPYCDEVNLEIKAMLEHVNSYHKHEDMSVVCPICASMPWGNSEQKSGNFLQHLNLRHRFEYDTFVDFHHNEDKVLKTVLEQSLFEQ